MNKENIYITKTLVETENFSELDFKIQDKFGFDYENENDFITIENGIGNTGEAFPIDIDTMIDTLKSMKDKGATHVEIEHHVDHIGYDISAFNIRKSSDDEIKIQIDKSIKNSEKEKKLRELYEQINKIQKEY